MDKKNVYCSAPNRPGLSNSKKNVNAAAEMMKLSAHLR